MEFFDADKARQIAEDGRKYLHEVVDKFHEQGIEIIDTFDKTINNMNTEKVKETAENLKNEVVNDAKAFEEKVENLAEGVKEKISETAHNIGDKLKNLFHKESESSDKDATK